MQKKLEDELDQLADEEIEKRLTGAFSLSCRRRPASSRRTATALALSSAPGVLGTVS